MRDKRREEEEDEEERAKTRDGLRGLPDRFLVVEGFWFLFGFEVVVKALQSADEEVHS